MGVDVAETVTDAHVQISSLMSKIMLNILVLVICTRTCNTNLGVVILQKNTLGSPAFCTHLMFGTRPAN